MRDLPHPFWAKNRETEKGHITAARDDLPRIAAHTAAGGPKRARGFVTNTGLDLRTRIPLTRFAASCAAPPHEKPCNKNKFGAAPAKAGARQLLDLDLGASLFELLLDGGRFVLVDAFLDGLRRAIHKVLGLFQAQAGDFADRFNDVDFVAATFVHHARKSLLLFPPCPPPPPP